MADGSALEFAEFTEEPGQLTIALGYGGMDDARVRTNEGRARGTALVY